RRRAASSDVDTIHGPEPAGSLTEERTGVTVTLQLRAPPDHVLRAAPTSPVGDERHDTHHTRVRRTAACQGTKTTAPRKAPSTRTGPHATRPRSGAGGNGSRSGAG